MEIRKIGSIGKVIPTLKRQNKGITIPNCFACYHNSSSNYKKRVRKGYYIIQFNGNTYYICKYCFAKKRKLKRILSNFS